MLEHGPEKELYCGVGYYDWGDTYFDPKELLGVFIFDHKVCIVCKKPFGWWTFMFSVFWEFDRLLILMK